MSKTSPTVSVIIATYNEQKLIAKCLAALSAQTMAPHEIIIVDNNSRDNTVAIVKKLGFKVTREPRQGVRFAQKTGFDAASGDVITRIDADSIAAPGWVAAVSASFIDPTVVAATGSVGIAELSPHGRYWFRWVARVFKFVNDRRLGIVPVVYGHNLAVRRSFWQSVSERVLINSGMVSEDIEMSILAHRAGKVVVNKAMLVNCHFRRSLNPVKFWGYMKADKATLAHYKHNRQ